MKLGNSSMTTYSKQQLLSFLVFSTFFKILNIISNSKRWMQFLYISCACHCCGLRKSNRQQL